MRRIKPKVLLAVVIVLAILVTAAIFNRGATPSPHGRLHGTIVLYPIGPACSQLRQCSRPAEGQLVEVQRLDGSLQAKMLASKDGGYDFALPPGDYVLVVPAARYGRGAGSLPGHIHIESGLTVAKDVTIDTGIR